MAEIVLTHREQVELRDLFQGKPRPPGVRPGTWHRLTYEKLDHPELDILEPCDLRAFAKADPRVMWILGRVRERG